MTGTDMVKFPCDF